MALSRPPGGEGQRLSHLRSIGSWAPVPGISQVIHFSKAVTLFGRNIRVVDYCLNSPAATTTDLNYISRIHARIIRTDGEYVLVDSSLSGVYVNDIRIKGRVNLREGDTVTFGHPAGKNLLLGSHARQPNSPFYFLFEHCDCCPDQMPRLCGERRNSAQLLNPPDSAPAGVSHSGNLNLAFAPNISRPQMTPPGLLPGRAPLASTATQRDHQAALAPPLNPALSPSTAPLPSPPRDTPEQSRFPSSSRPPLSTPGQWASHVHPSASPDYTLPKGSPFGAPESPLQESSGSGDSVSLSSRSSRESAVEWDRPPPQGWSQRQDARSGPGRSCRHPLLPASTCPEVWDTGDQDGSQKAIGASGPWEETLQLTPNFPTETGDASGSASPVFGPESPALSETDQDEEQAKMNPCPSMEETACAGESFASEPGSPAEEMEGVGLAGSCAEAERGSVDECKEDLVEKHPPKASEEAEEATEAEVEPEAEGVESRAVGLSPEIQVSELGQHDSAKRTAEIRFPSGEGPTNDSSTKISRQEKLDSGRRNALLPSRNPLPGTQSGAADNTVDSPEKVAASEDVEMVPATEAGLEDVEGHLRGRELEPEMSSAIPVEAEGVWDKASMVDLCAEMGMWADGVKPGKMEAAAAATTTESFKDVDPNQRPGAEPKERLLQKLSEAPILDEQFKGRFSQGDDPKDWSEASDTTGQNLHSPETREGGGGRAVGKTDWLQARPALRETTVLAGALETPVPEPPENLGELISEQCLFRSSSSRIPLENPVGERSVREEKLENPRSAESSNNWKEERAVPRLQDAEEMSENDDSSLGIVDVPVVGSSGGEAPGCRRGSGRERQGEFKAPPSEEESEVKRSIIGTSTAATTEDATNQPREAEDGLDKGPRGLAEQEKADSCSAADASRTRSPHPDPAERPSLGGSSREGLQEGRIPDLADCSLAGTQFPSPKSHREAGESLGSDSRLLLGCQDVPEDERLASLNEEGRVKTTVGGGEEEEERASPVPSIPLAVTRRDFDPCPVQRGAWKGPCSTFSSGSSYAINQLQCPIGVDPQGPESDIVEPENLESCLEAKSQGADVGGKLLYLEDPLRPDGGSEEAEAALEQISLPVRREPEQGVLIPEGSGWSGHLTENPPCRKARASPGLTLLQPGNIAVKLPVAPMEDSAEDLQWPEGDDGLHWQIPASEAEGEERGRLGPSKTEGLHERRDASCFHPAEQRANGTQSRDAFREPAEELATRRPRHPPTQEATAGPRKGMEKLEVSLEGPTTSSDRDQGRPVRAASSPAGTEASGASCSRKGRERAAEAPEEPSGGGVEPDPVNSAGRPANSPSESASESADDGRAACMDQGFMENTRQDLDQESSSVAGRPPGQPDTATVASPLGKAAQELPGSESSSSAPSGKGERAQKAGMALLPGQGRACQLGNGPEASAGWRGGFGCSEPCEALLREEEEPKSPPPRKRLQQEDLEGAAWHPKKLCEGDSASVGGSAREPGAAPPPPPLPPLEGSLEQFGQTMERFLHQCRNRLPLCSDPRDRKREAIARMVRNYFQSNGDSNEQAAETGPAGAPAGSSAREEGRGSGGPGQEDACHFKEEPLPMEVGSALGDCSSPVESPKVEPPEGPLEEEPESSWPSGISPHSQSFGPSPSPRWSHSDQALDGASGSLSEMEGDSPSDGDCEDENSGRPTKAAVLWQEDRQAAPRDTRPESVRTLSPSEQEAPGCWLQRGEPDGGDGPDGFACREDPVEAPEETAAEGYRRGMPAKGRVLPSGSLGGPPGQDQREPFRQAPWESSPETSLQSSVTPRDPPVKMEPTDEEPDGRDGRRKEPPPPPPPPPSGRPPVASALSGADSPEEGPSVPRPHPTPAQGAALPLVKEEPVQEDEALPSVGAASSLCAPCPSQAVELGSPGKELVGGAGQAASHQASQEAPWVPGTSASFPATDACGDGGPRSARPSQGDGCPLGRSPLADTGLRSQAPREEKRRLWPLLSHAPSSPPSSPSVSQHPLLPKTSADEQPEGPRPLSDFGGGAPGIPCQSEEAGLAEPSDAECLRVAAAVSCSAPPQVQEGVSFFRDPPARTEPHSSRLGGRAAEWASSEQDVAFQLQECQSVLAEILQALSSVEGVDEAHVEKWRDQIAALQKATKMPQTHIALVGNTGAGKSCLLNALLDEEAMLPTSAMRACTAVVVEIARGAEGSPYEAEVEFLSREEWNKELEALLEDMKDKAGNLKKRCPDRKTEAGAAYSRVKAVYGRVDELEKLEDKQGVTQHLGTVKHIYAETAADFRMEIEKFIDSRTDHLREMKGGEFWPIVKCVRIRVAKAEVLRTGAVLVDLPGTRDSNAGRDTAAQEYLKDCNAVWVTASITRAVDDKTAKELLSANFRRQLFMDGLYGSLAFVCTKTDSFSITDIVRDLNLQDKIRPLEEELQDLERQRTEAETEKKQLYAQQQQQRQEPVRKGGADGDSAWFQRHDILEKEFKISALQREKEARLRAISLICVQARNAFSKQRILMDFSAGLQEVSRRAEGEEDGEEEMDEGDSAGEQPANLEVFTVSSTEYLKLGGKLLCNGQPQVFHDVKDTEIPALKKFAMDTALKHSMVATEKVIRDVARVLSQMVNYLNSQRTQADARQAQVQEMLQQALQGLPALLQGVLTASSQDLRYAFEALILGSLQNGAESAKQRCEAIVKGWGSPVLGYPHVTYRAICNHRGVYTSPRCHSVDFNKELAGPLLKVISVAWNEVFSSKLLISIEAFRAALLDQLSSFFRGLKKKLHPDGPVARALCAIHTQQMEAARAGLHNFILDLVNSITRKQRAISRLLIPTIQAGMEPAYAACSQLSGPGYFRRMKEEMEQFVHLQKEAIFHSAVEKMGRQLERLQQSICCSLQSVAQELATSIRMQFEPLLRPVRRNKETLPALQRLCAKVDKLCQRSGVDYLLPMALQPEEPGGGDCALSPAGSVDVRVGALPLPHLAAIEQQSLENTGPPVPSSPEPIAAPGTAGQMPLGPLLLPWPPHGRKRAGEAVLPQLEKKTKLHPVAPAGVPWLPCSQRAEMKPPFSTAAFLGSCSPGASRPDGPPCPMAESPEEGEPLAVPCSAGLLWVAASQGRCRKPPSATVKEEEAGLPPEKTQVPRWL